MTYNGYKGGLLIAANYTADEVEASRHQPQYRGVNWQPTEQAVTLPAFAQEAHEKKARKSAPSQDAEPEQETAQA